MKLQLRSKLLINALITNDLVDCIIIINKHEIVWLLFDVFFLKFYDQWIWLLKTKYPEDKKLNKKDEVNEYKQCLVIWTLNIKTYDKSNKYSRW
jgi:hypothetical protein